jgi:hypothetical protein
MSDKSDAKDWNELLRAVMEQARFSLQAEFDPQWTPDRQHEVRRRYAALKEGLEKLRGVLGQLPFLRIETDTPLQEHVVEWRDGEDRTRLEMYVDLDGKVVVKTRAGVQDPKTETVDRASYDGPDEALKDVFAAVYRVVSTIRHRAG